MSDRAGTRSITIDDLELPARWDDASAAGARFRAAAEHAQRVAGERYGAGDVALTPAERLAGWRSTDAEQHVRRVAIDGDRIVGASSTWLPLTESTEVADHSVAVEASMDAQRRRAIIELLVDDVERLAAEHGRSTLIGSSPAAATGPVTAASGFGGADPADPEAAALIARGYALQQVYRISVGDVRAPGLDERWSDALARAAADGYETVTWSGETPAEHRAAMRTLHERMSTDAPLGGLALEPEVWSDERLAEFERSRMDGGRTMRTVVARRIRDDGAGGGLAGFTSLFVGGVPERAGVVGSGTARQHDTLVAREHRGHGLGMLLKLANLIELREHHPTHPRVSTWNAEENRHMLAVNEAVGFEPVAFEGVWQRKGAR